jgi:hypothetical protein
MMFAALKHCPKRIKVKAAGFAKIAIFIPQNAKNPARFTLGRVFKIFGADELFH